MLNKKAFQSKTNHPHANRFVGKGASKQVCTGLEVVGLELGLRLGDPEVNKFE